MRLLFRLLKKNVNFWQIAGFAFANLVGAVIVLFGIQAYKDAAQVLKSPDSVLSSNFLVLSKPVSTVTTLANALGAGPRSFTEKEIKEIAELDGVSSVATFRTARFPVEGGISYGGFAISTEMFVESVPDGFLDVDPVLWTASPDSEVVPVVIPRSYINFYNYGFAAARGTPQLGEELFSMVPLNFVIYGREGRRTYTGQIVGLTDRINSILVPDDFLEEANKRFSTMPEKKPTRVIVEAGSEASKALMDHIQEEEYVIDGGSEDAVRMLAIVRTIISIVVALGLLVSSLAFFLLLISILLLIEKNRYKNDTLHQLGYPDRMIALPYQTLAVGVDFVVWLVGALVTLLMYPLIASLMQTISPGFEPSGPWLVIIAAFGLFFFFALIHIWIIRRKIR
jgi:hypothetical protein